MRRALFPTLLTGLIVTLSACTALYPPAERAEEMMGEAGMMMGGVPMDFTAHLITGTEVPPVDMGTPATASGMGVFVLNADHTELAYAITYSGLSGPVNIAHFHMGALGDAGGVVRTICGAPPAPEAPSQCPMGMSGTLAGAWTSSDSQPLTQEAVDALMAGSIYVNFHTSLNGPGEVRGQILP
ncbi:MAG: CHRD domain-containing protein [Candidatus Bipolaricaulia bacterium]